MNNKLVIMSYELVKLTSKIASAYLSNNSVKKSDIADLINNIHTSLSDLSNRAINDQPSNLTPAIPPEESITPDFIICLEDGKKLKLLKRYLRTKYNMTPEEYRNKWDLPADYPMVSPNYAKRRSSFAKETGLGKKGP